MSCKEITTELFLCHSNLFRVFGTSSGSEEASTLESSKTPNRYYSFHCICLSSEVFYGEGKFQADSYCFLSIFFQAMF